MTAKKKKVKNEMEKGFWKKKRNITKDGGRGDDVCKTTQLSEGTKLVLITTNKEGTMPVTIRTWTEEKKKGDG